MIDPFHYQKFDFLGKTRSDSDSVVKYRLSKLDDIDLKDKSCLDVGCNAGYFLFKLLYKNPSKLVGIDRGKIYIDLAKEISTKHFKSEKFVFIEGDFFTHTFSETFDLIICFSTFHYFGELQSIFFEKCHSLLNEGALLLLEVEEFPLNEVPYLGTNTPRPADKQKYKYPNNLKMQEFVKDKYLVLDRYISVKQGGSLYDRYFYRLKRI